MKHKNDKNDNSQNQLIYSPHSQTQPISQTHHCMLDHQEDVLNWPVKSSSKIMALSQVQGKSAEKMHFQVDIAEKLDT